MTFTPTPAAAASIPASSFNPGKNLKQKYKPPGKPRGLVPAKFAKLVLTQADTNTVAAAKLANTAVI